MTMTQDKARKAATRQRMAETGEPYSVARHAVEREHEGATAEDPLGAGRGAAPRDDRWYASEAEEFRVQHLADLADKARERAEEAEETVSVAREAAELAQQAADMTRGWADKQEQERAQRRANQARAAAEEAQRRADQAQRQADEAEEAADEAVDLADETGDSLHTRPHRSYRARDHDEADPGRSHHPRGPADRLQGRLGKLMGRFELLMSRAGQTTNPAHDEPKDTDSD
jgi:hypothetical protein